MGGEVCQKPYIGVIMPVPTPVGLIHYDEPRAVMVRDSENQDKPHSAMRSAVNVFTDSVKETNYLIERWPEIMAELDLVVKQIINNMPEETPMGETDTDT
jgi:hypothetical protein